MRCFFFSDGKVSWSDSAKLAYAHKKTTRHTFMIFFTPRRTQHSYLCR